MMYQDQGFAKIGKLYAKDNCMAQKFNLIKTGNLNIHCERQDLHW
jgi:hypothetical protein